MAGVKAILLDLFGPGTWGTGGNLVASALLGSLAAVTAFLGRHRIRALVTGLWERHHPHKDKVDRVLAAAEAAHRIAAATHEHLTGERHPDSPPEESAR